METQYTTERDILDNIFDQDAYDQLAWKWTKGSAKYDKSDLANIKGEAVNKIPGTELALARSIGQFLKDSVVFVKSESAWYVWDGAEFIKTEGDWFIHKAIKEVATIYGAIMDTVAKYCASVNKKDEESDLSDKFTAQFGLNRKLQSASALEAFSKLLKSELDEIPEGLAQGVPFLTFDDLESEELVPAFIKGYLPAEGIGQFYGDSYTGKTLAMVDLALSICAGLDEWLGEPLTTSGPSEVLYVLAEGKASFRDAVKDWKAKHPEADLSGLYVHDLTGKATLNITPGESAPGVYGLADLREQCKAEGIKPSLMILDPQANILAGVNEDSNSEMVAALTPVQKWSNEDGFLTLLIHHSGKKDKTEGRGASAQKAMMDVLINIKLSGDLRTLSFEKVKGAAKPDRQLSFRIIDGVVTTSNGSLSPDQKSYMETIRNRATIKNLLKDGTARNVTSLVKACDISKGKVSTILKEFEANGIAHDLGPTGHPNWVLIGEDG